MCNILVAAGADVNHTEQRMGAAALHFSCSRGHVPTAKLLLENDADVAAVVPGRQWTALHHACANTQSSAGEMCKLLLNAMAHRQIPDEKQVARYSLTPLIVAVKSGSVSAVTALLSHKHMLTAVDSANLTAVDWVVLLHSGTNPQLVRAVATAVSSSSLASPQTILNGMLSRLSEPTRVPPCTYLLSAIYTTLLRRPNLVLDVLPHIPQIESILLGGRDNPQLLHWGLAVVATVESLRLALREPQTQSKQQQGEDQTEQQPEHEDPAQHPTPPVQEAQLLQEVRLHSPRATEQSDSGFPDLLPWILDTYLSDPVLQRAALEAMLLRKNPKDHVLSILESTKQLYHKYDKRPKAVELLLRRELGFGIEAAGEGLTLSGKAAAGQLLAFIPGMLWEGDSTMPGPAVQASGCWSLSMAANGKPDFVHPTGWKLVTQVEMNEAATANPLALGHQIRCTSLHDGTCNAIIHSFSIPRAEFEELKEVWPVRHPSHNQLLPGDVAVTHSLKRTEMNGILCDCLEWLPDSGRWKVKLRSPDPQEFCVLPAHLYLAHPDAVQGIASGAPAEQDKPEVGTQLHEETTNEITTDNHQGETAEEVDAVAATEDEATPANEGPMGERKVAEQKEQRGWGNWLNPFSRAAASPIVETESSPAAPPPPPTTQVVAEETEEELAWMVDPDVVIGIGVFALRRLEDEEVFVDANLQREGLLDAY
eukprot:TRINITY_DN23071_c0_g1_i2.p1 TRINITY_DN23071_c0_g1~~TRINITY_DN23071_c0_g1_i2.p1  ORF type:complete len:708 (+),score=137.01 TRINITY_DN23071_c0_g1_i2:455-2578(+)